jgi:sirohydrochlorin ferrochelatase
MGRAPDGWDERNGPDEVVAVVVVDHGSRRVESNTAFESFVRSSSDRLPYPIVEVAHMELAEPSVGTAVDRCVAAGATVVVVAPWFLGPGRHWDRDLPGLTADAAARHRGMRWLVAAPLGPDPLLVDLVDRRVARCLAHAAGRADACEACAGSDRCGLR